MFLLLKRHVEALLIVVAVILPVICRNRARPVIFSKYSGIGDIVCTFPAALELKKRHPKATFIYNCHPDFACLPKLAGVADIVTTTEHIGLVGYWYRFLLGGFYAFASDDDRPNVVPSEVYIKDFGRAFGLTLTDDHPQLQCSQFSLNKVKALIGRQSPSNPLIVFHSGPSWPVREWPIESWRQLVIALRNQALTNIVRIGASKHLALGEVDSEDIPGVFSLVDQLSLEESIALISMGDLFIGIDSGMLHLAAAVRTPSVGLWGPTSPELRFSESNRRFFIKSDVECQGCHHRFPRLHWITGCPYDIKCMKSLPVEAVVEKCLSALAKV